MAHGYQAVKWYPFKRTYDAWIGAAVGLYLALYLAGLYAFAPAGQSYAPVQALMRATGSCAFVMLSLVLCLGPLARLHRGFLPMLFNRRHLGVATFGVGLAHAALVILWYHFFGAVNPLVSVVVSNSDYGDFRGFPFETLGAVALIWLFVMAATSHDFWNANLGPGLWKSLHMGVYAVYGLLVAHAALGGLQRETDPLFAGALIGSVAVVAVLHVTSGLMGVLRGRVLAPEQDWLDAGPALDIPENRARVIAPPGGERIAIFRYDGKISAVSNVCRHQSGPLGEGRVIDGCITCPWHGFQYRPQDGCSPAPFTEKIATYRVRLDARGHVWVDPRPQAPGTPAEPALLTPPASGAAA